MRDFILLNIGNNEKSMIYMHCMTKQNNYLLLVTLHDKALYLRIFFYVRDTNKMYCSPNGL